MRGLVLVVLAFALVGAQPPGSQPGSGGETDVPYQGVYELSSGSDSMTGRSLTSAASDMSGVWVSNKASLVMTQCNVYTTGNTSDVSESQSYGLDGGVIATAGGVIVATGLIITTTGEGANGIFSTGTGSSVTVSNLTMYCYGDSAHGVDATAAGYISVTDAYIETMGVHSGALSTDTGGGTVLVNGGTYITHGGGSPGIMSTGRIEVQDAEIYAYGCESSAMDGSNIIWLKNVVMSGYDHCFKLYNSMPQVETTAANVTLTTGTKATCTAGDGFYVDGGGYANPSLITIEDGASITSAKGVLATIVNGALCTITITGSATSVAGSVSTSGTSTLDIYVEDGGEWAGSSSSTAVDVVVSSGSTWAVNDASKIGSLSAKGELYLADVSAAVACSSTATIGGALVIDVTTASSGVYTLLTASSVSGTFSSVSITPSSLFTFKVTYTATAVTLSLN